MTSKKTTIGGILMILAAILNAGTDLYNGKSVDWQVTMGLIAGGIAACQARDNTVSDQEAGVRPEISEL